LKMGETTSESLAKEGWTKRFTTSEPRLSEAVQIYEELGFEVRIEPADPKELLSSEACSECYLVQSGLYWTIYTRPLDRGSDRRSR
jgi:hypothetical protein